MKTSLIILSVLFTFQVIGQTKAVFPTEFQKAQFQKEHPEGLIRDGIEDGTGYEPDTLEFRLMAIPKKLYKEGVITIAGYNQYICKIEELKNITKVYKAISGGNRNKCRKNFINSFKNSSCRKNLTFNDYFPVKDSGADNFENKYHCSDISSSWSSFFGGDKKKQLFQELYKTHFVEFVNRNKNNTQTKVGAYEISTVRQCEANLYNLPYSGFEAPGSCQVSGKGNSCEKHEDCCSSYCKINKGQTKGMCLKEYACYPLIPKGNACNKLPSGKINPYCDNKEIRHAFNPASPAPLPNEKIEVCLETNFNTSEIGECTDSGQTPTAEKLCCSDKVGADGKCVPQFTCDICYKGGEDLPAGERCCPGYYQLESGKCVQDFPPLHFETKVNKKSESILKRILNLIIAPVHAANDIEVLSMEERQGFAKQRTECLNDHPADSDAERECLKGVASAELALIQSKGVQNPDEVNRQEYLKKFNRAVIADKKKSDFSKCEFHSFNDNWNASSDTYRNAEMVVRGFEYIYSGTGTIDYWVDENGKSFFERAQSVGLKLRENRRILINKYKEIDARMTEDCKAFFASIAPKESGSDSSVTSLDDNEAGNTNVITDYDNVKDAEIAEIDRSSSGIKQMELLARFTRERREAKMDNFVNNSRLEAELEGLSKKIEEMVWEKSESRKEKVYSYRIKKLRGFWEFFAKAFNYIASVIADLSSMIIKGIYELATGEKQNYWQATNTVTEYFSEPGNEPLIKEYYSAQVAKAMYSGLGRSLNDVITRDWYTTGNWFWKYQDRTRYYFAPHFNARDAIDEEIKAGASKVADWCDVKSSSRLCFKNIHQFYHVTGEGEEQEAKLRFLLDVKYPLFVESDPKKNPYETESLINLINTSHTRGLNLLRNVGFSHGTDMLAKLYKPMAEQQFLSVLQMIMQSGGGMEGRTVKMYWLDENNHLEIPAIDSAFYPKYGNWKAAFFAEPEAQKFLNGAKKYAGCLSLKECGAVDNPNTFGGIAAGDYGFGYLISSEADKKAFSEYVYQHHFIWPSLASTEAMGYPTLALSSYFQSVAYYVRIIGSLAKSKAGEYNDLLGKFELYLADLEGEYSAGSGTYNGKSKQAKYSKEFYKKFLLLDFQNGANVDGFVGKNGEVKIPKSFSKAEGDALNLGVQKALRAKALKAKKDHYVKTVGKTKRGQLKLKTQDRFLSSFGKPIDQMSASLRQGLKAVAPVKAKAEVEKSEKSPSYAGYKAPQMPNYGNLGNYNSGNYGSSEGSSTSGSTVKTGLSDRAKNGMLIDSAMKDKSLLKRNDGDSIFKVVTKAYFRNLDRILERTASSKATEEVRSLKYDKKSDDISDKKRSELKKLLSE